MTCHIEFNTPPAIDLTGDFIMGKKQPGPVDESRRNRGRPRSSFAAGAWRRLHNRLSPSRYSSNAERFASAVCADR